jgi:isochorismate hydrolase
MTTPIPTSGATPYNLASWQLSPGRTALVVIDMQNDFLHADGWYNQSGIDITHMQQSISRSVPWWRRRGTKTCR